MAQNFLHGELRGALAKAGMTEADLGWLDAIDWQDGKVPPVESEAMAAEYGRRERALNAVISGLLAVDRKDRLEARLAAAIGAEIANWRERGEED